MSAGMADIIAAHQPRFECYEDKREWLECSCRMSDSDVQWRGDTDAEHAAHVAEELAKAGYGNVQEAKAEAVRETAIDWAAYQSARMPRSDVLQVPVWLNQRAAKMEAPHGVD